MNLKFEIKFHIKIFKHNMGQMKLIFLFLILSIKKCTALQIWTLMCLLRYIQNWLIKIYPICSSKFEKSLTKKEGKVHTDQLKLQKRIHTKKGWMQNWLWLEFKKQYLSQEKLLHCPFNQWRMFGKEIDEWQWTNLLSISRFPQSCVLGFYTNKGINHGQF